MNALQQPPVAHFANLFLLKEHYLVSELQGLKIAEEVADNKYPMMVRVHPLRCGIEVTGHPVVTFNAFRVCATEATHSESTPEKAVWSQRVTSVMRLTGSKTIMVSQGLQTTDKLPKGIRSMMLQNYKKELETDQNCRSDLKLSQVKMMIFDVDWDRLYTGYLLALHVPYENPWA